MKTKTLKQFALVFILFVIGTTIKAQTVPITNNLSCAVVIGFELRDPGCTVCDPGYLTIPGNSTVMYTVDPACGGVSNDGCFWVVSIKGVAVAYNHMSWNFCCMNPSMLNGIDPSGCSSSGTYNVIYNYPASWTINP